MVVLIQQYSLSVPIINQINKYIREMKSSFDTLREQIKQTSLQSLNKTLQSYGYKQQKLSRPQQSSTLTFTQCSIIKLKDSPWLKHKQSFQNRQNLYLRIVDLMKMFIRFEEKNFITYAWHLMNGLQNYRQHGPEFQIIFYLVNNNNRKQIALYIKLRKQILARCGLNTTKFNPISVHNQSKNFMKENVQLGPLTIDYTYWGPLAEIAKTRVSEDMLWWLSEGSRMISAVEFVRACLWSQQSQVDNPQN